MRFHSTGLLLLCLAVTMQACCTSPDAKTTGANVLHRVDPDPRGSGVARANEEPAWTVSHSRVSPANSPKGGRAMFGFLRRMFQGPKSEGKPSEREQQGGGPKETEQTESSPLIKAYDKFGREIFITREVWIREVLPGALEEKRDDPEQLAGLLIGALQDGAHSILVPYGEQLQRIDPDPLRSATLLGIIYMHNERFEDSERVLKAFIAEHGEVGIVLANLAKVYSYRGDENSAESTLWHALELDPNQDNGVGWYLTRQHERDGDAGVHAALLRIAAIEGSWRAQMYLAREELDQGNLAAAQALYAVVLSRAGTPSPIDVLTQVSGDLGTHGHLNELLQLVGPRFVPSVHGLWVGDNLMRAYLESGQPNGAKAILEQLFALQRPDWQEALHSWENELGQAGVTGLAGDTGGKLQVVPATIEGPLWARETSPYFALLAPKAVDAPTIMFFGSTALLEEASEEAYVQLSLVPGRISRALPLLIAEEVSLGTDGETFTLIPWVQDRGFVVMGADYSDADLCSLASKCYKRMDYIVAVTLDAREPKWKLQLRLVRVADGVRLAEEQIEFARNAFGEACIAMARNAKQLLTQHAGLHLEPAPDWYVRPTGSGADQYLIRLEQLLAVSLSTVEDFKGGQISGVHEIIDGTFRLSVETPTSGLTRVLLAELLRELRKARPELLAEYKDRVELLQTEHPLPGKLGKLVEQAIHTALAD